jgi:hypothetical protein
VVASVAVDLVVEVLAEAASVDLVAEAVVVAALVEVGKQHLSVRNSFFHALFFDRISSAISFTAVQT